MSKRVSIQRIIREAAGISFEVRRWADVIEKYVNDYVKKEKEKHQKENPQPQRQPQSYSWSYNDEDVFPNSDYFVDTDGNKFYTAIVSGHELKANADVKEDFPGIEEAIKSVIIEVEFTEKGVIEISSWDGFDFPEQYRDGIEEMVEDHILSDGSFYNEEYDLVKAVSDDVNSYYDDGWDYYMKESYNGWSYYQTPKIDKIEINGKDFPKEYKDFSVDKWVINSSSRIEYDHRKSGYNDKGEYVVHLNMPMSSIGGSALIHEIKHAFDDWNRISKGAPPLRAGWEIKNIYTPDFEKLVLGGSYKLSPMLHPIIRYYYLGSKLETPAYLENEYDNASFAGDYRGTAKKIMNFKASSYLNKKGLPAKGLQESWTKLITEYDIPFFRKFKNVVDFLNYTEKYFNKRGRDIIKRIDKMRYVHNRKKPTYQQYKSPQKNSQTTNTDKGSENPNQLQFPF